MDQTDNGLLEVGESEISWQLILLDEEALKLFIEQSGL